MVTIMSTIDPEVLRARFNTETARIGWNELERHFARGVVRLVARDLDLVDVAVAMHADDVQSIQRWTQDELIVEPTMNHAARWHDSNAALWAVVVAHFVLIQEANDIQ